MPDRPADFIASFMEDYFAEAQEHLDAIRRGLLDLESSIGGSAAPPAVIEELFRGFHSIKGISAMVELREAERLAHEMESCLGALRVKKVTLTDEAFEALVDGTALLSEVVAARRAASVIPAVDGFVANLAEAWSRPAEAPAGDAAEPSAVSSASGKRIHRITFTPSPELVSRGIKVDTIRARLSELGSIESVVPRVAPDGNVTFEFIVADADERALAGWRGDGISYETAAPAPEPAEAGERSAAPHEAAHHGSVQEASAAGDSPHARQYVRVDLARLDEIMRLVGELVVSRSRLEATLARAEKVMPVREWRALSEDTETMERHLRDLSEGVMRVRLVPVAEIFRRMPFVVRDLARDTGKRVRLELVGQGTEIDKLLVERMTDPILHLVRNAVSHGIETLEERTAAGKPLDGLIRLAATTVGESVIFEVGDDGRGMNLGAIAERAKALGVAIPGDGRVDSRELLDVICSPGFSTTEQADRASGRGVGMSVARAAIEEMGGTLDVETTEGAGTTFRATLPLTLAITDAFIVHVADRTFAVPQALIQEVAEVEPGSLRTLENNELMTHRGRALPVVRLSRLFSIESPPLDRMHVIVVGSAQARAGVLVDRISGRREIVVKALGDPLVKVAGVSGATQFGDGQLVLIVDIARIVEKMASRGRMVRAAAG